MSTRSFGSVFMVATCAGAALGCYLVSLRVASERAQLEEVEARIVDTQRDLRTLQTEIGRTFWHNRGVLFVRLSHKSFDATHCDVSVEQCCDQRRQSAKV